MQVIKHFLLHSIYIMYMTCKLKHELAAMIGLDTVECPEVIAASVAKRPVHQFSVVPREPGPQPVRFLFSCNSAEADVNQKWQEGARDSENQTSCNECKEKDGATRDG